MFLKRLRCRVELGVVAVLCQQFGVGAHLADALAVDVGDEIRIADGGQAVGDDEGGASHRQLFQCRLPPSGAD